MTIPTRPPVVLESAGLCGRTLFLATPMYGGNANANYIASVLALQKACSAANVGFTYCFLSNESLITRARNELTWRFIHESKCSHLLFVDADIAFDPADILTILHCDKDVIALPYAKKRINWDVILAAVRSDPDIRRQDLERLVGDYVFTPNDMAARELEAVIKVKEAGTGLMLIKRGVFDRWDHFYRDDSYVSDDSSDMSGVQKRMRSYFTTGIVGDRYMSEDYMFCRKWRDLGGEVWLYPWAETCHFGTYGFAGSVETLANVLKRGPVIQP